MVSFIKQGRKKYLLISTRLRHAPAYHRPGACKLTNLPDWKIKQMRYYLRNRVRFYVGCHGCHSYGCRNSPFYSYHFTVPAGGPPRPYFVVAVCFTAAG